MSDSLHRLPQRLVHRDYHARNLMVFQGQIYCLDFQDTRWGPVEYDIVSLVNDPYVEMEASMAEHLIQHYLKLGPQSIVSSVSQDTLALQGLQRSWKVCGSFSSFFNLSGNSSYLCYIESSWQKVLDYIGCFSNELSDLSYVFSDLGLFDMVHIQAVIEREILCASKTEMNIETSTNARF